jgi:uncharacterized protein YceH (UPF0502 family)
VVLLENVGKLNEDSIRVFGIGSATIVDVQYVSANQQNDFAESELETKVASLRDEIKESTAKLDELNAQKIALEKTRNMLVNFESNVLVSAIKTAEQDLVPEQSTGFFNNFSDLNMETQRKLEGDFLLLESDVFKLERKIYQIQQKIDHHGAEMRSLKWVKVERIKVSLIAETIEPMEVFSKLI